MLRRWALRIRLGLPVVGLRYALFVGRSATGTSRARLAQTNADLVAPHAMVVEYSSQRRETPPRGIYRLHTRVEEGNVA